MSESQPCVQPQNSRERQYRQLAFMYAAAYIVLFAGICFGVVGRAPHATQLHAVLVATPTNEINRTDLMYWITGNGAWSARWEGTSKDTWLAVASIVATLWMVCEYWRYAHNCDQAFDQLQTSNAKTHVLRLRRVFMQSMLIHTCTGILVWWVPTFWVIVVLTGINARQTRRLNTTKIQVLHAQELANAATVTAATLRVLDNPQVDVHERLDQVKILLMQRVTNADS